MNEPADNGYPKRENYFAHKAVRVLFKSCAAQDIGQNACLLVVHVAHTEDAARYQGSVRFWNSQLMETLGFSEKQLRTARQKAIDSGWLHYERSTNRSVGRYWVTVPGAVEAFDDAPIEPVGEVESLVITAPQAGNHGTNTALQGGNSDGIPPSREGIRPESGRESGRNEGSTSNPYPSPSPKEKRESAAPPLLPDGNALTPEYLVTRWNAIPRVIHCRDFTAKRKAAFRERCGNAKWVKNLPEALDRAAACKFLQGENPRGWRADMEWLLKPDSVTKIVEGKYGGDNGNEPDMPAPWIDTADSPDPAPANDPAK